MAGPAYGEAEVYSLDSCSLFIRRCSLVLLSIGIWTYGAEIGIEPTVIALNNAALLAAYGGVVGLES